MRSKRHFVFQVRKVRVQVLSCTLINKSFVRYKNQYVFEFRLNKINTGVCIDCVDACDDLRLMRISIHRYVSFR